MKGNVLKLEMGYTMANYDGALPIDDCFAYGSMEGCDEYCPVLIAGQCELQDSDNAELYQKAIDASFDNLTFIDAGVHQSFHNKGKTLPPQVKAAIIKFNHSRKGQRRKLHRPEITPLIVYNLRKAGLSFNEISKRLNLDWGCVRQRYKDAIHNNKEPLKKEE